jgi:hypothetical protein
MLVGLGRWLSLERLDQVEGHDHKLTAHTFARLKQSGQLWL